METKIHLNDDETLKKIGQRNKGPLSETEIYSYEIVNSMGVVVGSVEYTEHLSIKGLRTSRHVIQKDNVGVVVIEDRW